MTLAKLLKQIRSCDICKSELPFGPRPVLQADSSAKILVAGQAPGVRVHNTGIPFNDPSGDRLRQWMGIDKEIFYNQKKLAIIPMGFCYPGTAQRGDLPPRPECAAHWRQVLLSKLPEIELTLVIGQYAMGYHLTQSKKISLTETVRNWQQYAAEIIPLPHPSPRNNIWLKKNPWFELEVIPTLQRRVKQLL